MIPGKPEPAASSFSVRELRDLADQAVDIQARCNSVAEYDNLRRSARALEIACRRLCGEDVPNYKGRRRGVAGQM